MAKKKRATSKKPMFSKGPHISKSDMKKAMGKNWGKKGHMMTGDQMNKMMGN